MRRRYRVEFHPRRGRVVKLVPDQATSVARPSDQRPAKLDESPSFGQNPGAMADFCLIDDCETHLGRSLAPESQNAKPKTMLKVKGFVAGPLIGRLKRKTKSASTK